MPKILLHEHFLEPSDNQGEDQTSRINGKRRIIKKTVSCYIHVLPTVNKARNIKIHTWKEILPEILFDRIFLIKIKTENQSTSCNHKVLRLFLYLRKRYTISISFEFEFRFYYLFFYTKKIKMIGFVRPL